MCREKNGQKNVLAVVSFEKRERTERGSVVVRVATVSGPPSPFHMVNRCRVDGAHRGLVVGQRSRCDNDCRANRVSPLLCTGDRPLRLVKTAWSWRSSYGSDLFVLRGVRYGRRVHRQ